MTLEARIVAALQLVAADVKALSAVAFDPTLIPEVPELEEGDEMLIVRNGQFYRFKVSGLSVAPSIPANVVTVDGSPVTVDGVYVVS